MGAAVTELKPAGCAGASVAGRAAGPVEALAFTVHRAHSRHAGRLPHERILDAIAAAEGPIGRCADYLIETVASLRALGICEAGLAALNDRLAARGGA